MARLPKPDRLRQRDRDASVGLIALDGRVGDVPAPAKEWLASTITSWDAFWTSALSELLQRDTDMPAVVRLFGLRDERERMIRLVRRARVVSGASGQPRANPLYSQVNVFDSEIRQLEDRLGLSPRARLQLGVTFGDAARSLADLNRELARDDDRDATETADLRLTLASGAPPDPRPRRRPVDGAASRPRTG